MATAVSTTFQLQLTLKPIPIHVTRHIIFKKKENPFWNKFWKILRHNMHFKDNVHVYIHFFQAVNRLSQRQFLTYMM